MGRNDNVISNTSSFLGAMSIERVVGGTGGRVAGALVQPAVWVATGTSPDGTDVVLYGVGLINPFTAIAAGVTGIIKGAVDDQINNQLAAVRLHEPSKFRPFIEATYRYSGMSGSFINAMTIASKGGTAWQSSSGLWVYITDAKGRLIPDYKPKKAKKVFQPVLPLQRRGTDFLWTATD